MNRSIPKFLCVLSLLAGIFTLFVPLFCKGNPLPESAPEIIRVYPVHPSVLAIEIQEGVLKPQKMIPYVAHPENEIETINSMYDITEKYGITFGYKVMRKGQLVGYLNKVGSDSILMPDSYSGLPLSIENAESPSTFSIRSLDDPNFDPGLNPEKVMRKAKPNFMVRHEHKVGTLHTVFLRTPYEFKEGAEYLISFSELELNRDWIRYTHQPRMQQSEAVHINQAGFAPSDPVKCAYLSMWTGSEGGLSYGSRVNYHVVDEVRAERVFSGVAKLHWSSEKPEQMIRDDNYVDADVYRLDFSALSTLGKYHVYVEGVGCSYSFEIRPDAWEQVSRISLRGIFHQRSGFEFIQPYTDYWRPRAHDPRYGGKIYQSRTTLLETTMGIELGKGRPVFPALIEGATDELVADAWGGVMDGGDWDRRAQHLVIPRLFMEAYELSPDYFHELKSNIPESNNALPDIIDEALWILDFYKRMQWENGAVSGGVESAEHPAFGDTSWRETPPTYAYWPDYWSTHEYVAAAAVAARVLQPLDAALAAEYRESAIKGMIWAEQEFAKEVESGRIKSRVRGILDIRNLAALELFRVTGDEKWMQVFEEHTVLNNPQEAKEKVLQRDSLFSYLQLPVGAGREDWKQLAREILIDDGDQSVEYGKGNAFSVVAPRRNQEVFIGFYSGHVHGQHLVRAHVLTGDDKYLHALFAGAQFSLGANPDNLAYMEGIGVKSPQWMLYEDSIKTGRKAPEGVIPYGPFDQYAFYVEKGSFWVVSLDAFGVDSQKMEPDFWQWPVTESYIDMWNLFMQNECTPWQTMAPSAYSWGYMAAVSVKKPFNMAK